MKPSDCFGVVVRTIGLLVCIYGAWCLIALLINISYPSSRMNDVHGLYLGIGLFAFFGGMYMMGRAHRIVRYAYREESQKKD